LKSLPLCETGPQLASVRELLLEYAQSLGFSLSFQGFERELATLPGGYAPPFGCLLLAFEEGRTAGCVGVRRLDGPRCEMKRLYVRPPYRATGLGRMLAERAIASARQLNYRQMLLDTLPGMQAARKLYTALGFRPCAPYYDNPCPGAEYLELEL
jgi:GNAT superfamily N-acetyltransferase